MDPGCVKEMSKSENFFAVLVKRLFEVRAGAQVGSRSATIYQTIRRTMRAAGRA